MIPIRKMILKTIGADTNETLNIYDTLVSDDQEVVLVNESDDNDNEIIIEMDFRDVRKIKFVISLQKVT